MQSRCPWRSPSSCNERANGPDKVRGGIRPRLDKDVQGVGVAVTPSYSACAREKSGTPKRSTARLHAIDRGYGPGGRGRRRLRRASGRPEPPASPVEVTLVDRRNFHLFQPLDVPSGDRRPIARGDRVSAALDLQANRNVRVLLAEVAGFDLDARELHLREVDGVPVPSAISYDTLVVAGGSHYSFFGHNGWGARGRGEVARERARRSEQDPQRLRGRGDGADPGCSGRGSRSSSSAPVRRASRWRPDRGAGAGHPAS